MNILVPILGIMAILGGGYLFSTNKKEINWKGISCAFLGQIILSFILIKTPLWKGVQIFSNGVSWVLNQSTEGINFVFGGVGSNGIVPLFISGLLPIVFVSALIGILFHFGILQKFIALVGNTVAKVLNIDTVIAVNGVSNMVLGQSESLFLTKQYLPKASDSVIFGTLVGGMCSISASIIGVYVSMGVAIEWIIVSLPLNIFSAFILTQLIMPAKYNDEQIEVESSDKGANVIETMMGYAMTGFQGVIGITVALIVFLSMVALINNFIGIFFDGVTLQSILGILFTPIGFLMGVPSGEVVSASQLLATKLVTNEAVAYSMPQFAELSVKAKAMITVALCGFSGIGSIGILIGGYSAIAKEKVKVVAKLGFKALLTATACNILTGTIAGLML